MEETLLRFLLLLLFLLLHSLLVSASMASHAPFSLQSDAKALITFSKTIEEDPYRVFQNWSSNDPCFWTGINCYKQRVVSLNLGNSGLMGFLRLDLLMAVKSLRYVFLQGTIPSNLANCTNLAWLSLANNRLTGPIPPSIGTLNKVGHIQLSNNSLTGNIPPELGNCQSLTFLDLNSNNLTGSLPQELTKQTGQIIAGVMAGTQIAFVYNVYNKGETVCRGIQLFVFPGIRLDRLKSYSMLHGCPPTLIFKTTLVFTFKKGGSMFLIDVSYNSLTGTIDESFGSMPYMHHLRLSHNEFTGTIPESFGGLKSIVDLDLSYNQLHGHIPNSVGTLSALNAFDVSNNNLSGKIPPQDRLIAFPAAAFENNSGLCGFPLPECGAFSVGVAGGEPSSSKSTGGSDSVWKELPFSVGAVIGIAVSLFIQIKFCRKYMAFGVGIVVEIAVCLSIVIGLLFAF